MDKAKDENMRFIDIINFVKAYFALGIATVFGLTVLFCVGYFLIYKKLMKGIKSLTIRTVLLATVSACYIVVVLGVVFLNRGNYDQAYVLQPFYSYVQAWNEWSAGGWRNIILNILIFVPFGFLLQLWSKWFRKAWRTILCGFAITLAIELVQFATSVGVFETDDLIGNTFGVLIGYGFGMLFLSMVQQKKLPVRKTIGYIAPALIMAVAFGGIFAAYSLQELGNIACFSSLKVNMDHVSVSSDATFSVEPGSAMIYSSSVGNEQTARELAQAIFVSKGTTLDETQSDLYDESALFYSEGRKISIWVTYLGNTYRYNDFPQHSDGTERVQDVDEATIREALREMNIELPEACIFEVTDIGYQFTADMAILGEKVMNGMLSCDYYSDGTIKSIRNNMIVCNPYRTCNIISEAEAYEQVKAGRFVPSYFPNAPCSIKVESTEVTYVLDSKGYYQPVYRFNCLFTGAPPEYESYVLVPAKH